MTFTEQVLRPVAAIYSVAARLRAAAYRCGFLRPRALDAVVISVGNLTVGGTGKTPMVLWIAERLRREGAQIGILSRGYRGWSREAGEGLPGSRTARSTSDEVELLSARLGPQVAFGVGARRFPGGAELVGQGVKWLILDDGFQHLELARNVDIVLLDATNPFGGGRLLPAGRLREPRSALARADVIVITRADSAPAVEAIVRRYSEAPVFYARVAPAGVRAFRGTYPGGEDPEARSKRLFAFCGIGNPGAFVADLRTWGFRLTGHRFFPDHHAYTEREIGDLWREAVEAGAGALICTEKDIFNLGKARSENVPLLYCPISIEVRNEDEFWRAIKGRIERPKRP
ncbi:MAG TPA: tetraacyldisaccharide 4'-kinase [Candidatus Cybelea sp.]|nr:tetraacyldisaccharide 4'-kinase [Candidatus Cybelea sp.]